MKELRRQLKELLQQAGAAVFEGQVFMTEEELRPFLVAEKLVLNGVKKKGRQKKPEQTWQSYC